MKGIVKILDTNKEISFLNLPIKREKVIEESVKIFNDDDPCVIHYTHCNKKICFELLENLKDIDLSITYKLNDLPKVFKDNVDLEELGLKEDTEIKFI